MTKTTAIILAAGKGTRMRIPHAKTVQHVAQRPMVWWVTSVCEEADISQIIVVVGHKQEEVRAVLGDRVLYAEQKELLGTGHAVKQALPLIEGETVVILSGDVPLTRAETLKEALVFHKEQKNAVTVLTAEVENPYGYGRIVRTEDGCLKCITEQKDADEKTQRIREVNSGMYCFDRACLLDALGKLTNQNAQGEYYLTDTIGILHGAGYRTGAYCMADPMEMYGVNDLSQLSVADRIMRERIARTHALAGVQIWNAENTYIAPSVQIAPGAKILPGCILSGETVIGPDAVIGPDTVLESCMVGEGCTVMKSVAKESVIGAKANVGPFAYIRPGSRIGIGCKVGDFVEIKNTALGDGTKVSHLTYVGDADVGQHVNFGCGTVTVNYDGKKKYRTKIGDKAFIGCNTNLVAPVTVEKNAYIAAGSTITDTVPEDTLAIARARQVVKHGWSDKRKAKEPEE